MSYLTKNAVVLVKGEAQRSWQESREEPTRPGGEGRHPGAVMGPRPRFGHQYAFASKEVIKGTKNYVQSFSSKKQLESVPKYNCEQYLQNIAL